MKRGTRPYSRKPDNSTRNQYNGFAAFSLCVGAAALVASFVFHSVFPLVIAVVGILGILGFMDGLI
jgi:hypothetical protein